MDYFPMPAQAASILLLVFAAGVLVGRAIAYWQYCRDMFCRNDMVGRVIMPFEERFKSPLSSRRRLSFEVLNAARSAPATATGVTTAGPRENSTSTAES